MALASCSPKEGSLPPRTWQPAPLRCQYTERWEVRREKRTEMGERHSGRRSRGYDSQRRCLPFFLCYPRIHETSLPMTTATALIWLPQLDAPLLLVQSNDMQLLRVYLSSNMVMRNMQTVDNRLVIVEARCKKKLPSHHSSTTPNILFML